MRIQSTRQEILAQNRQVLSNIAQIEKEARRNRLRAKGYILYSEAKTKGFKKVGWDVYQQPADVDAGRIWSLEEVDGDKWLVCYTDSNDHILRTLTKEAFNYRMQKKASHSIIESETGFGLQPGDLVEITPRHEQSVHSKYTGLKGVVSAAMPDRAKLTFRDGNSMWFENNDLTPVVDAKEMQIGDNVRMFSNNVSGKIIKISHDNKYVTFQNDIGQEFSARKGDIVKTALLFVHTDPFSDAETKSVEKMLKHVYNPAPSPAAVQPSTSLGQPSDEPPPSIKQSPTSQEVGMGTAVPASNFTPNSFDGDFEGGTPSVGMPMVADINKPFKTGRRMNVGDPVQKKSTGEKGIITDIQFDRKLGKFYIIDFGAQELETIYDTDLMKLKNLSAETEALPMPAEITPGPTRFIGAKRAVLSPQFEHIKSSALEFVSGMVAQALQNHEAEFPGKLPQPQLDQALTRQAITTFMSKYLPMEYKQVMGAEDKNALSEWLLFEMEDTKEDAPTTQEFTQGENTSMPAQKTTQEIATDLIASHIKSHIKYATYLPAKFVSPIERNRFLHETVTQLQSSGVEQKTAHFIGQSIVTHGTFDTPFLRHTLQKQFRYTPERTNQLIDVVSQKLANSIFTTTQGIKYALDLPGMETLRGGGGGYPGGMNIDPMGWEVKNPMSEETDSAMLEKTLEEQLMNQSKPFDEAAPKLNIELDSENKQIIIDYNQEKEPTMPIEGGQEDLIPAESPNMPNSEGLAGPKPGDVGAPGGNSAGNFNNMDIPVNF